MNSLSRLYWFTRYYKIFLGWQWIRLWRMIFYMTLLLPQVNISTIIKTDGTKLHPITSDTFYFVAALQHILSGTSLLVTFSLWSNSSKIIRDKNVSCDLSKTRICKVPFSIKKCIYQTYSWFHADYIFKVISFFSFFLEVMQFDKWNLAIK